MNIPGNSGPPPCHFLFANAVYLPLMPPLDQTCGAGKSEALSQAVRRGRRGGGVEEEEARAGKRIKAREGESEAFSGEKDNIRNRSFRWSYSLPPSSTSEPSVALGIFT